MGRRGSDRLAEQVVLVLVMMGTSGRSVTHTVRIRSADRMTLAPVVARHNHFSIRQVLRTTGPVTCPTTNRRSSRIPKVSGLYTPFATLIR